MNLMLLFGAVSTGSRPTWPCAFGSSGSTPRTGARPRRPGPSAQLFRANVESCTYFFGFVAVVSGLFWVFFYLI